MRLSSITLKNNLFLAPMLNVSTSPFRRFCRNYFDIGLVSIPMLYTKRIVKSPKTIQHILEFIKDENPISLQLISSKSEELKEAILYLNSYDFDVLDINAGCPSKRAIKAKEGGYLMKDLNTLSQLVDTAIKYSDKPVSIKMRNGFDNSLNIRSFSNMINDSALEYITIHARLIKDGFKRNTVNLDLIKAIKETTDVPIVGNGDISDATKAKEFMEETKVDGIMVGRHAMGNPEIFLNIDGYLRSGKLKNFTNDFKLFFRHTKDFKDILNEYLQKFKDSPHIQFPFSIEDYKFQELKRNIIWLTKGLNKSTELRIAISNCKNLTHLYNVIYNLQNMNYPSKANS